MSMLTKISKLEKIIYWLVKSGVRCVLNMCHGGHITGHKNDADVHDPNEPKYTRSSASEQRS